MKTAHVTALVLAALALPAAGKECPPPLPYAEEKATLIEMLRTTRDENAGRFLTRELNGLWAEPPDAEAAELVERGVTLREADRLDVSEAAFDALVAYCPAYVAGYEQRALTRMAAGDGAGALADLEAAAALAPDHAAIWGAQAVVLMRLGRFGPADAALDRALALNPWLPERRLRLAPPGVAM